MGRKMRTCAICAWPALIVLMAAAAAQAGGYNRLKLNVTTVLPPEVKTVGEAAFYLTFPAGYSLLTKSPAPQESEAIAARPVSPLFPRGRMMTIESALLELIGSDARLVVDHEHRLYSFEWHKEGGIEKANSVMPGPGAGSGGKRLHGEAGGPQPAKP